jgi:hypothetical protein
MMQALVEAIHFLVPEGGAQKLTELTLTVLLVNMVLAEVAETPAVTATMVDPALL